MAEEYAISLATHSQGRVIFLLSSAGRPCAPHTRYLHTERGGHGPACELVVDQAIDGDDDVPLMPATPAARVAVLAEVDACR